MNDRERELLTRFFYDVRWLLGSNLDIFEGSALEPSARVAWSAVAPRFDAVEQALVSRDFDLALDAHGLSGPELELKLAGFYSALRALDPQPAERAPVRRSFPRLFRRRKWRHRALRLFGATLRWADIIIGSVGAVIPAAAAIDEFKQVVEAAARTQDEGSGSWRSRFFGSA